MAINADDYYGKQAFLDLYRYLTEYEDDIQYHFAMGGYHLKNTLTENGHVARGVCSISADGYLTDIAERTHIAWRNGVPAFTEDDGATWTELSPDATVSMNMWGFSRNFLRETEERFSEFLEMCIRDRYYTMAIWSGFDDNSNIPKETDRDYHKIIWKKIMDQILSLIHI